MAGVIIVEYFVDWNEKDDAEGLNVDESIGFT